MSSGSNRGIKIRSILIVAVGVLVCAAAGGVFQYLNGLSHHDNDAIRALSNLELRAADLAEFEARLFSPERHEIEFDKDSSAHLRALSDAHADLQKSLHAATWSKSVDEAVQKYTKALTLEFELYAAGKVEEAREVDEEAGHPAYDALREISHAARADLIRHFDRMHHVVEASTLGTLAIMAVLIVGFALTQQKSLLRDQESGLRASLLAENERRVSEVLNQSAALHVVTDPEGNVKLVAGGHGHEIGDLAQRAIGNAFACLVESRSAETLHLVVGKLQIEGSAPHFELVFKGSSGSIYTECTVTDQRGNPLISGYLWSITDVTAARTAAKELEETHSRLSDILDSAVIAVGSMNADGTAVTYLSGSIGKIYGEPSETFLKDPRPFFDAIVPEDRGEFSRFIEEIKSEGSADVEYRITRKDGEMRWLVAHGRAVLGENGVVTHLDGFIRDCTEQRLAQLALEESQQRYNRTIENVPGIVFRMAVTARGEIEIPFVSPRLSEVTGLSVESVQDNPWILLASIDSANDRAFSQAVLEAAAAAAPIKWDGAVSDLAGNKRWYQCAAQPEPMADGRVVFDGILVDVSERKMAEASERERIASQKANEAKSHFLSRMSHELRTPLNAILGFGQVLEMRDSGTETKEMASHILTAGRHLLTLVNDVLDISSIESGNLQFALEPVNVAELTLEVCTLMAPLADDKGVTLEVKAPPRELEFVEADSRRLRQILINLISNGVKYNRPDGKVTVSFAGVEGNKTQIVIDDTGQGIAPEVRSRLFTSFDRLGAESSGTEGTGLGLALSRKLAHALGGDIRLEDAPGGGCRFIVELTSSASRTVVEKQRPLEAKPVVRQAANRLAVLYIEDNHSNIKLMETVADLAGVDLRTSTLGQDGFKEAMAMRPDLILLDLDLPDIGGMDVLKLLKSEPRTLPIPVFVVSADANAFREDMAIAAGAAGYITKPFQVNEVLEVLSRFERPLTGAA